VATGITDVGRWGVSVGMGVRTRSATELAGPGGSLNRFAAQMAFCGQLVP